MDKDSVKCGVLWDMDGVIVDTYELHLESWDVVLPDYGIEMTEKDYKETFGMNNKMILTILMQKEPDPDLLQEVGDRKEAAFREIARQQKVTPMPGVVEWLERFTSWGCSQAIASSAPHENIDTLVAIMKLNKYFKACVSGAALPAKPDPAIYLEAARQLGVVADNCVVIEDAVVGVEGAHRAGMSAIGVTSTHDVKALNSAEIVTESMAKLDRHEVMGLVKPDQANG
jgi:beta-phosphoglucomutase